LLDSGTGIGFTRSWAGRATLTAAAAVAVALMVLAGGVSSARAAGMTHALKHKIARGTSTNWSGFAVDGTGATKVTGTWSEPSVSCAPREKSWSSPWVGIDGDTSSTVEQTGTDSDCRNGKATYYAWYEMYPKSLVVISMAVHPMDSFTGTVVYSGSSFTLTLTDNTTRASFSTVQVAKSAARSSVEWIMEGPSNGLLSNFGSVQFSGASATIGGQPASPAGAQPITMVNAAGTTARAVPNLSSANSFGVTWEHS
jgi:Peptidase A4 family